jgi:hypothetical protein
VEKANSRAEDRLLAKRRQDRMGNNEGALKPFQAPRQVNSHDVNDLVCIDDIIDYTIMHHEVNKVEVEDDNKDSGKNGDNALLAFMAGQGSSSGDIRLVKFLRQKERLIRARIDRQTKAS